MGLCRPCCCKLEADAAIRSIPDSGSGILKDVILLRTGLIGPGWVRSLGTGSTVKEGAMRAVSNLLCLAITTGLLSVAPSGHAASQAPGSPAAAAKPAADKALFDTDDPTIVKRSSAGVCHDRKSPSFEATIHFRGYRTMKDCIDSGGRVPGK